MLIVSTKAKGNSLDVMVTGEGWLLVWKDMEFRTF